MSISRGGGVRGEKPVSIGEPDKVTSWPFTEPKKTSSWQQELLGEPRDGEATVSRDARLSLVDYELEKAKRRTAEILAQMAPPGGLHLPPLLEAARLKWGIPDGAFKTQAVFDRIHIFPIDAEYQKETYGNSSIHMTDTQKKRELQNGHRGVLLSMGLEALDHCYSHGIELGHIVQTIRNAPHAQQCALLVEAGPMHYLIMRDGDLTGSETLMEDYNSGRAKIVDNGGEHSYCFNIEGRSKKKAVIRDSW